MNRWANSRRVIQRWANLRRVIQNDDLFSVRVLKELIVFNSKTVLRVNENYILFLKTNQIHNQSVIHLSEFTVRFKKN